MPTSYPNPLRRGQPRASVSRFVGALCLVAGVGCASNASQMRDVSVVDPDVEEEILFDCAQAWVEAEGWPLAGSDRSLRHLRTEWVGDDAVRRRIAVQIYTHPRFGPGGQFDVQRETWDGPSETWGRVAANPDDRRLSQDLSEAVATCWSSRSAEAR